MINHLKVECLVRREVFRGNVIEVLLRRRTETGIGYADGIVFKANTNEGASIEPTFTLEPQEAQNFMDELYRAGFRPTDAAGSTGQLAAVHAHLADLRKMVPQLSS